MGWWEKYCRNRRQTRLLPAAPSDKSGQGYTASRKHDGAGLGGGKKSRRGRTKTTDCQQEDQRGNKRSTHRLNVLFVPPPAIQHPELRWRVDSFTEVRIGQEGREVHKMRFSTVLRVMRVALLITGWLRPVEHSYKLSIPLCPPKHPLPLPMATASAPKL